MQAIYRWTDAEFQPDKIESECLLEENHLRLMRKDLDTVNNIAFFNEIASEGSRNKSDAFQTFLRFQKRGQRFLNKRIISVRTDEGFEFCNQEFEKCLDKLGIRHEKTNLYSPEMNGVAERFNLTALDGVKT
ncbi:hypothetical protein AVEN_85961-1 [Araneus ventricosus]|uniref:Integrase catalytic domain-containing protein n=1 Tax=Araneus ventricosus TaxID=182803 RepID=A0A4Y2G6N7_ARAVE|nr:hypothetical protein AVEN_85961-1 [Araneus ventricosus]